MSSIDFNYKVICDNIHGHIGISNLEHQIINTRTFQRLKKIKQLGFAHYVFPGAEHSRFVHSIGVMHVMSRMVDGLRENNCQHLENDFEDKRKQELRLAALLHDIGHYPLSHLGEDVFRLIDYEDSTPSIFEEPDEEEDDTNLFMKFNDKRKSSPAAKHEKLGELILTTQGSEIKDILESEKYDPVNIAKIFKSESKENQFYTQLMSATLDCDRLDYLLRDSKATGTIYGNIDLEYILQNIDWDPEDELVCFRKKALNAIEHFITGRYFSYNITYHKTVIGFELIAKVLFYAMVKDDSFNVGNYEGIVHHYKDIEDKIKKDREFLANFNDEYFWYYLELYKPKDKLLKILKQRLYNRKPLRTVEDYKYLEKHQNPQDHYYRVLNDHENLKKNNDVDNLNNFNFDNLAVLNHTISFEGVSPLIGYQDKVDETDKLKIVKIKMDQGHKDILDIKSSILPILSEYKTYITRVYALVDKNSSDEQKLIEFFKRLQKKSK